MAYRRLLLPLNGTALGESAMVTGLIAARIRGVQVLSLSVNGGPRGVFRFHFNHHSGPVP